MSHTLTEIGATRRMVDPRSLPQVMTEAVERNASVRLEDPRRPTCAWEGTMARFARDSLIVTLRSVEPSAPLDLEDKSLLAHFQMGSLFYHFETRCLGQHVQGGARSITLARPDRMWIGDRRRTRRRELMPSVTVRLQAPDDRPGRSWEGSLLNASPHGMACRVDALRTRSIRPGVQLLLDFALGDPAVRFRPRSRVASITPTTEDHVVLGLEFVWEEDFSDDRAQLAAALAAIGSSPGEGST